MQKSTDPFPFTYIGRGDGFAQVKEGRCFLYGSKVPIWLRICMRRLCAVERLREYLWEYLREYLWEYLRKYLCQRLHGGVPV